MAAATGYPEDWISVDPAGLEWVIADLEGCLTKAEEGLGHRFGKGEESALREIRDALPETIRILKEMAGP